MSLLDRFRLWFDYEIDAHQRTLEAIDSVPATRREEEHQQAIDLFAHLMTCRRLWLHRIGSVPDGPATASEIFPRGTGRAELEAKLADMRSDWEPYFDRLDHEELGRTVLYTTTEGRRFESSVEEILTQLFGHALHHRGQIMALVRRSGGEPAPTDFVYWSRRAAD